MIFLPKTSFTLFIISAFVTRISSSFSYNFGSFSAMYKYLHGGEWYKEIEGDKVGILKSVLEDEKKKRQEEFKHRNEVGIILKELYSLLLQY